MIEELLNKYSHKFPKGYPSFENQNEREIFINILKEDFNIIGKFDEKGKFQINDKSLDLKENSTDEKHTD
jgi:hypothetical protein